ncbi:Uncharacterised protein [Chlamydia abortus]|nr:Uncharacterised protein [Chlamydia abortus]
MKKKNKLINILLGSMLPTTIIPSATAIGIATLQHEVQHLTNLLKLLHFFIK